MSSQRRKALAGAAVAVAAAATMALLVTADKTEVETREPVRTLSLPEIPKTLPAPKQPSKVVDTQVDMPPVVVVQPKPDPGRVQVLLSPANKRVIDAILDKNLTTNLSKFKDILPRGTGRNVGIDNVGTGTTRGRGNVRMGTGRGDIGTGTTVRPIRPTPPTPPDPPSDPVAP